MGWWERGPDDEEDKRRVEESKQKLKESWKQFTDGIERDAEREREWLNKLDELTATPNALDNLSESELEYYLTQAEGEIEYLRGKTRRYNDTQSNIRSNIPRTDLLGGILSAISGIGSNALHEQLQKNERLVRLIKAKRRSQQKALPKPTRAEELARKMAEKEQERQESITLLEQQRDAQKRKYPDQADSIDRRYRRMIEAILEEE